MQAEERDPANLWDMIGAARAILDFTDNVTLDDFLASGTAKQMARRAVERELEILGEAAARISLSFRNAHPEIPWKEIVGLRNVISHQYEKVNYAEIHGIVSDRIPELIALLEPLVPPAPPIEE